MGKTYHITISMGYHDGHDMGICCVRIRSPDSTTMGYDCNPTVPLGIPRMGHTVLPRWIPKQTNSPVIRHKRSRNLGRSLFFGCVTWAVLMGSILIPTAAFAGPDPPFSVMGRQVQGARNRIERLNEAVELTPSTFWQFWVLEKKKLLKETQEKQRMRPMVATMN
jgi:hypothetical protein